MKKQKSRFGFYPNLFFYENPFLYGYGCIGCFIPVIIVIIIAMFAIYFLGINVD